MMMLFFCVVTPCGLVDRYQRIGGTYCLHIQGIMASPIPWNLPKIPHRVTTKNYNIDIFTAVRTSNVTYGFVLMIFKINFSLFVEGTTPLKASTPKHTTQSGQKDSALNKNIRLKYEE
jgi:hypothetical protein